MPHRHSVLLIDDHADGLEAMQGLIEAHGFTVATAGSGEEALALLQGGESCCLIVVDWRMPGMTGEQFLKTLRASHRLCEIPLLVVTGDPRGAEQARALGIRNVAFKPVEPSLLLGMIGEHCSPSTAA